MTDRTEPTLADHFAGVAGSRYSEPFEQYVLGAMLAGPAGINDALETGLEASDFYKPAHAALYSLILESQTQPEATPTEPQAMAHWLTQRGDLGRVGGLPYLHTLFASVPTTASTKWYAQQLIDLADRRGVLTALAHTAQVATSGADAERLAGTAEAVIRAAAPRTRDAGLTFLGTFAEIGLRDIEMRKQQQRGIQTGFIDLDRLLGGLRPGQLVVVAARPAMGKTTLGMDIARHTAIHNGLTVAFISLEMTIQELFDRCLSAEAGIEHQKVRDGDLDDFDWHRATRALGPMGDARLGFSDETDQTVMRIGNKLRKQARRGLDLAVIDHIGLIKDPSVQRQGRQVEVAKVTRELKELAKQLLIPVVALVQLNREVANRSDKTPQLTDLRESGEIEQSADIVIMLHREDYYDPEVARAGECDLVVRKNRGGPTDTVTVAAQLHLSRFVDMATQGNR